MALLEMPMVISGSGVVSTMSSMSLVIVSPPQKLRALSSCTLVSLRLPVRLTKHVECAFADSFTVIGTADELTGQAVHTFVTLKPYVLIHLVVHCSP